MTGHYIAQVNFQSKTGLAKDRFINTFHFIGPGADVGTDCVDIAIKLANFYNASGGGPGEQSIAAQMADSISPSAFINIYDFDTAKPRVPYVFHFTAGVPSSPAPRVPEEVALCLSFFSVRNSPTTRNRVYLGPFNTSVLGASADTVTSRPTPLCMQSIIDAATRLAVTDSGAAVNASNWVTDGLFLAGLAGVPGTPTAPSFLMDTDFPASSATSWVVHSPIGLGTKTAPSPMWGFVTGGWVDNEWDGQDRRRVKASSRLTFAS